jgi:hypothetical protein
LTGKKIRAYFLSVEIIDCHHIKNIDVTINYFSTSELQECLRCFGLITEYHRELLASIPCSISHTAPSSPRGMGLGCTGACPVTPPGWLSRQQLRRAPVKVSEEWA